MTLMVFLLAMSLTCEYIIIKLCSLPGCEQVLVYNAINTYPAMKLPSERDMASTNLRVSWEKDSLAPCCDAVWSGRCIPLLNMPVSRPAKV